MEIRKTHKFARFLNAFSKSNEPLPNPSNRSLAWRGFGKANLREKCNAKAKFNEISETFAS